MIVFGTMMVLQAALARRDEHSTRMTRQWALP